MATMVQDISRVLCWHVHEDGTRSLEDLLELPCSISEAPHLYDRHWGQHRVHSGPIQFETGYTIDGNTVVYPYSMRWHAAASPA